MGDVGAAEIVGHHAAHGVAGAVHAAGISDVGIVLADVVQQFLAVDVIGELQLRILNGPQSAVRGGVLLAAAEGGGDRDQGRLREDQHDAFAVRDVVPEGVLEEVPHGSGSAVISDHNRKLLACVCLRDVNEVLAVDAVGIREALEFHAALAGDRVGKDAAAVAVVLIHERPCSCGGLRGSGIISFGFTLHSACEDSGAFWSEAGDSLAVFCGCGPVSRNSSCVSIIRGICEEDRDRNFFSGDAVFLLVGIEGDCAVCLKVGRVDAARVKERGAGDCQRVFHGVLLDEGADLTVADQIDGGAGLEPLSCAGCADGRLHISFFICRGAPLRAGCRLKDKEADAFLIRFILPAAVYHKVAGVLSRRDVHCHEHRALGSVVRDIQFSGTAFCDGHLKETLPEHRDDVVLAAILRSLLLHEPFQLAVDQRRKLLELHSRGCTGAAGEDHSRGKKACKNSFDGFAHRFVLSC